jgi:uncharacterized protein YcfJ
MMKRLAVPARQFWRYPMTVVRYLAPALLIPSVALAGGSIDHAKVVDVEPVYRSIEYQVPTEQCRLVDVPVHHATDGYRSYTAPILGAIIGGAIGNAVGHSKTNKKVGTAVGAVLGGTIGRDIGHDISRDRARRNGAYGTTYRTEEVCETVVETRTEQELDGYDVTYRYAGQTHTTRMDRDPGNYVRVRVHVTPV